MGKNPSYLPAAVRTVGAMIDDSMVVTWHCSKGHCADVDLQEVAARLGRDYSLVDKQARCKHRGCNGVVHFRYAAGRGTPSRRLEALRERQDAQQVRPPQVDIDTELRHLKRVYNLLARSFGRPELKD